MNSSFTKEPTVELLIARTITVDERDGTKFYGKNPRLMQFEVNSQLYQVSIQEKLVLDRRLLTTCAPAGRLKDDVVRELAIWTANRYRRLAFPHSFNKRLLSARGLERTLRREAGVITALYVRLNTFEELPDSDPYRVELRALMRDETRDNQESEQRAIKAFTAIVKHLSSCPGIEIVDQDLLSEGEFTLTDLRQYPKWDLDYISTAEAQDAPPE